MESKFFIKFNKCKMTSPNCYKIFQIFNVIPALMLLWTSYSARDGLKAWGPPFVQPYCFTGTSHKILPRFLATQRMVLKGPEWGLRLALCLIPLTI